MTDSEKLADYFLKNTKYKRIMRLLLKNYEKYGEAKGSIFLDDATMEECDAINSLISPKKSFLPPVLRFRMRDFEKSFSKTIYSEATLEEVLRIYFKTDLISNREKKNLFFQEKENFFQSVIDEYSDSQCVRWLQAFQKNHSFGYRTFMNEYNDSREKAAILIHNVCNAVNSRACRDAEPVLLAVLSARITGDSHYFDKDNAAGKLLIHALAFLSGITDYRTSEEIKSIYSMYLIEPDSISAPTASIGIRLYLEDKTEHIGYKCFADLKETVFISSMNLLDIRYASSVKKTIFVVENPMVFTALKDVVCESDFGLLCTSGQIKSSGLKLIDMLIESGCDIYYSGDLDPEGLGIADKLYTRYNSEKFHIWRMSEADYKMTEKSPDILPDYRLKKMININSSELKKVSEIIFEYKRAVYQELLISFMIEDIRCFEI